MERDDRRDGREDADEALGPAETAELEQALRRCGERAPATLDRRVATLLDGREVVRKRWSARRWLAAAAGIAALALVGYAADAAWRGGDDEPAIEPPEAASRSTRTGDPLAIEAGDGLPLQVTAERTDLPRGDGGTAPVAMAPTPDPDGDDWDPPEPGALYGGVPRNLDARETFQRAPFVARLVVVGVRSQTRRDGRQFTRPVAVIAHVYHGDRARVGQKIELHRQVEHARERAFLCWNDEPLEMALRGTLPFVTCFELIDKPPLPDGTLHAQQLLAESWGGTWLMGGLPDHGEPPTSVDGEIAELLADLASSLNRGQRRVDLSIVSALRWFDGDDTLAAPRRSRVWDDSATSAALLVAGRSRDARVRWHVAWMDPAAAGAEGVELLADLAFDEDTMVRSVAAQQLAKSDPAVAELFERRTAVADPALDALLSQVPPRTRLILDDAGLARRLEELRAPVPTEVRVTQLLDLQHVKPPTAVAALREFLHDSDAGVRQTAAFVLATAGDDEIARAALREVRDDDETAVRAVAGYAQLARGDGRGGERLRLLLAGDDARGRVQAAQLLARAARGEGAELGAALAAPLLFEACRNADPLVRSEAVVALARGSDLIAKNVDERRALEEALEAAARDESPLVRAAVVAARGAMKRSMRDMLRQLGYPEGGDEEGGK